MNDKEIANERPRLLLVDDDPVSLRVLAETLRDEYELSFSTDGRNALSLAAEKPDLILLDCNMPDMSGFDVFRTLQADAELADIPVVFVTGEDDPAIEVQGIRLGAADYITKPYASAVLKARVRAHLDSRLRTEVLERMAIEDGLTGLANRRYFDLLFEQEWLRAQRDRTEIALMLVDIDHFKRINDTYGHPVGDEYIRQLGRLLDQGVHRPGDFVARYGGEEFVLLLADTDLAGALHVAENLLEQAAALVIRTPDGESVRSTVSLGLAVQYPSRMESRDALLVAADRALYQAKEAGRNRVRYQGDGR